MTRICTLIAGILLLFLNKGYSQTSSFTTTWSNNLQLTSTNGYSNQGRKIVVNQQSGDVYLLGDFTTDQDTTGQSSGAPYSYVGLVKYDIGGNLVNAIAIDVLQHTISGFEKKSAFGMEIDNAGNIYIGYTSYSATSSYDVNLAKYNSSLDLVWKYVYNATTEDKGLDLKLTSNGILYALIKSNSGGNDRNRILKASGNGTSVTAFYTFTGTNDYYSSMAIDTSQNIYVTGFRILNNLKILSTACVTSAGALNWRQTDNCGNSAGNHFARYITCGADGGIYITGSSQGTVQHGIDVVVMKYNPFTGKKIWEKFINYNLADGGFFVSAHELNFVYVIWTESNTIYVDQLRAQTGTNGVRASFSPIPDNPFSSLDGISVSDLKVSNANCLYITGTLKAISPGLVSFNTAFVYKLVYSSRGTPRVDYQILAQGSTNAGQKSVSISLDETNKQVYWLEDEYQNDLTHNQEIIRLQSLRSPGVVYFRNDNPSFEETSDNTFELTPSPATHTLRLSSDEEVIGIEVIDLNGRTIINFHETNPDKILQVDIHDLPAGIYTIKGLMNDGSFRYKKFIKI